MALDPMSGLPKPDGKFSSHVLALNSGSSSLKFGIYRVAPLEVVVSGEAASVGGDTGTFHVRDGSGNVLISETVSLPGQREAIERIARFLTTADIPAPMAVGHRIVHGGPTLRQHCLIDDQVVRDMESATAFAPLHMPAALSVVRFAREHFPGLAQVVCFDTTFHAGLPDVSRVLPIARTLRSAGIQRYGFHGLSCESIVRQLGADLPRRMIIAHLGNGASLTAVKDGTSIDTSMGLTPTGGVIMGTRSGDLDPGVLIYLMREKNFDAAMLEDLVNRQSGLLGISGLTSDMRRLHDAAAANPDARFSIDIFCYSVRKQMAAMIAALDGVDLVVFTGGIGEHDAEVRARICAGLSWMGIVLDDARNRCANNPISGPGSRCLVRVLESREDEQIALHTRSLLLRRLS